VEKYYLSMFVKIIFFNGKVDKIGKRCKILSDVKMDKVVSSIVLLAKLLFFRRYIMCIKTAVSYVSGSVVVMALYLGAIAVVAMCSSGCVEFAYGNKIHLKTQAPNVWTKWFSYDQPVIVSGEVVNTGLDGEGVTIAEANKAQSVAQSKAEAKKIEARLARIEAESARALVRFEEAEKQEKETVKRQAIEAKVELREAKKARRGFSIFRGRGK